MNRWLIVIIVVLAGALLLSYGASNSESMDEDGAMRILYYSMWLILAAGGIIASQRNWGQAFRNLLLWTVIVLGLVAAYLYRSDAQDFASRMSAGLIPGRAATMIDENGFNTVVLYKARNGHYQADMRLSGVAVPMMVDTGASMIALSFEDAEKLGLKPQALDFSATVMTANGPAKTAYVTLPEVSIGGISRTNVRAGIAERGKLDQSLLGMNFLETLTSVTFSNDELRLRD